MSNFYDCTVEFEGLTFTSSEAAFQAAKIKCPDIELTMKTREIFTTLTAKESKRAGRLSLLRADWEEVKDQLMLEILRDKFTRNSELREKLIATGD